MFRAESSRLAGLFRKSPAALGEPYVTEAEIEHRMSQELQAQRDANLCLDPRDAEIRVRAWLHREQLRRMHPRETDG